VTPAMMLIGRDYLQKIGTTTFLFVTQDYSSLAIMYGNLTITIQNSASTIVETVTQHHPIGIGK
jgi:hypothetical protein